MGLQVQQTSLMQEREGSEEEFTSSTLSGHEAEGLRETHDPHRESPTAKNHHDTSTPESELEVRQSGTTPLHQVERVWWAPEPVERGKEPK